MEEARRASATGSGAPGGEFSSPRRAAVAPGAAPVAAPGVRRGRLTRRIVAPLAMLSVVGLAASLFVLPGEDNPVVMTDPQFAAVDMGAVSRSDERPSLFPMASQAPQIEATPDASASAVAGPSPSASPSPSPSASATKASATPTAEPTTASPTPKPSPTPTVDYGKLADSAGTLYASASVNVRTGPGTGYDVRTTLAEGDKISVTSWTDDGWRQVVLADRAGWIKGTFLTDEKPAPAVTEDSSSNGSGLSMAPCAAASGAEAGLTTRTVNVLRAVCNAFPSVTSYGGYRADSGSYHGSGQAIDVMISGEAGWEIARWARSHASELGVIEVLYSQQIWTAQRAGDGWRWMSDRGSASANHYDHVHISVR